jgi:parallel beta-helix repeat protein
MLTLTLISVTLIFHIYPAMASGTICIKADGSVDPPTAPISSLDNITYTFTDDISDSIVVERNNIIIDGDGHTLQGSGSGNGFYLNSTNNVIIKRTNIEDFEIGILLEFAFGSGIFENTMTNNSHSGIFLIASENNSISGNIVTNNWIGVGFEIEVNHNSIVGNKITNNGADGIFINDQSNYNIVIENYVADNAGGIYIGPLPCSGNLIFHNNFIDNVNHQAIVTSTEPSINTWDDGYPSGGNYWSDYTSRYPSAQEIDSSGIWDTPYNIDEDNQDNYPLIEPWGPPPSGITAIVDFNPNTLNLKSHGKWITARIQLPEEYNAEDIDASTILLNGAIAPLIEAKQNGHGVKELVVRFDRVTVALWIYQSVGTQHEVSLTITGELKNGTTFEGTDTIWALWRGYSSSYKR